MFTCPLCKRIGTQPSDHHLIPVCRGGPTDNTEAICRDCHDGVHAFFTNKELESIYNSIDALMGHEKFAAHVRWLSKQDPSKKYKSKRMKGKHWGRNG